MLDDCAAACDNNSRCKSFAMSEGACILLSDSNPTEDNGWFNGHSDLVMYTQKSRKDLGPTATAKTMSASRFDGSGKMYAGTEYNSSDWASGSQFNTHGQHGCHLRLDWSGVPSSDITGNPNGCDHGDCCILNQLGAKACPIPGVVTSAQPIGGSSDTQVKCTYQSLDPNWLNNNKSDLSTYFDGQNLSIAQLNWCNNLSVSQLAETTNETFCKQAAGSSFAQFLTQKLKGSDWFTDPKGFQLLNEACIGDSTTDTDCSTLLASVPASTTLNSYQVDQINGIITGASSTVKTAGSNLVKTICDRDPTNPQCACYNLVKYKIDGCSSNPNFPGCSDPDIQAVVQLLPELATMGASGAALKTNMNMFSQNLLASANSCVKAALSGTNVLLPNKPSGSPVQLNTCVQRIDLSGAEVSGSDISAACNINAGSSDTPPKANPKDVPQDGPNVGLIAGGIGGTTCIMSSSSSVCLLILAAVLMIH